MSNGDVCCILGICCPPDSASQVSAFANELQHDTGAPAEYCAQIAAQVLKDYDLAPKGLLQPLKDRIATMARAQAPHE
jgi:hypothetical protein